MKRIFSPDHLISFCHDDLNLPSSWELFSISCEVDTTCTIPPPLHWNVNQSLINTCKHIDGWPEPEITCTDNIVESKNYEIIPIDTSLKAYYIKIDSIQVVIISDTITIENKISQRLFEKTDIVIISAPSSIYAESVRKKLRPRLLITTAKRPAVSPQPNIIFTEERYRIVELLITTGKNIKILKVSSK